MGKKTEVEFPEISDMDKPMTREEEMEQERMGTASVLQTQPGRADLTEKPAYDLKRLSRDFGQIFKAGGKVRKSPVAKKYTLREAMRKLNNTKDSIHYTQENNEACEISFVTDVSLITIKGAAAIAIRQNEDFWYDFIDAGWEFYFVGC